MDGRFQRQRPRTGEPVHQQLHLPRRAVRRGGRRRASGGRGVGQRQRNRHHQRRRPGRRAGRDVHSRRSPRQLLHRRRDRHGQRGRAGGQPVPDVHSVGVLLSGHRVGRAQCRRAGGHGGGRHHLHHRILRLRGRHQNLGHGHHRGRAAGPRGVRRHHHELLLRQRSRRRGRSRRRRRGQKPARLAGTHRLRRHHHHAARHLRQLEP